MFVKDAYEKRLKKQEEQINNLLHLKKNKPPKIGSIRNDKINYDQQQQYFSKDDIPNKIKTIKENVKIFIDPDHLGLRKRQWNSSVSVPKNMQSQQTQQQKLLKIKLGFLDHPLPKYKQPLIYDGTDTRDDYTNWNVSNQIIKKQIKENLLKKTMSAFENSKLKQAQLLENYLTPFGRTTNYIQNLKKQKEDQRQLRQALKKQYQYDHPNASEQKINGSIFKLMYQTAIKEKKDSIQLQAMKTDFKATLSQTQQSRISVVSQHTGMWQKFIDKSQGQSQQYWAWSCCMNQDHNNRGCVNQTKDLNRWNFSSFNNS